MQLPEPGQEFAGKFLLLTRLGEGGMGVVYRARQLRLERDVALKIVRPHLLAAGYEPHRFEREARVLARLQDPHVVRIFDSDRSTEGLLFLVMELLEGRTLASELAQRGRLSVSEAVRWTQQCCQALSAAEAAGVVHRDIKPSNIFLAEQSSGPPQVKLLDFGITKLREPLEAEATQSGLRLGTPRYMSPEQLRATASVDHRSDLWSLGVVLYEMLSGRPPFDAQNDADLTVQIVIEEPRGLSSLRSGLPDALCQIVARSLCKDPERRYQHARDLAAALRPFLDSASPVGSATLESEPGSPSGHPFVRSEVRESDVKRRGPWRWAGATAALLAIAGWRAFSTPRAPRAEPAVNVPSAASPIARPAEPLTSRPAPSVVAPLLSSKRIEHARAPSPPLARSNAKPPASPRAVAEDHRFERENPYSP